MSKFDYKLTLNDEPISSNIEFQDFMKLSESSQKAVLDSIENSKSKEGGLLGIIFGNKKEIAAMNITFMMCILLVFLGWLSADDEVTYWNMIIPAITTGMGFMFGKGKI